MWLLIANVIRLAMHVHRSVWFPKQESRDEYVAHQHILSGARDMHSKCTWVYRSSNKNGKRKRHTTHNMPIIIFWTVFALWHRIPVVVVSDEGTDGLSHACSECVLVCFFGVKLESKNKRQLQLPQTPINWLSRAAHRHTHVLIELQYTS